MVRLAVTATVALAAAGCGGSPVVERTSAPERPRGVRVDCSMKSSASFPGAYQDRDNLVVGPLAMIGAGRLTSAETVREFGGNKFPLLVRNRRRVTVAVRGLRGRAGLTHPPGPDGPVTLADDAHRVVTFVACRRGRGSGRVAPGRYITFWSGFVLTDAPRCVRLDVWVDDEPEPRRAAIPLGARCD